MKLIITMIRSGEHGIHNTMTTDIDVKQNAGMFFTPEQGWIISSVELKDDNETK